MTWLLATLAAGLLLLAGAGWLDRRARQVQRHATHGAAVILEEDVDRSAPPRGKWPSAGRPIPARLAHPGCLGDGGLASLEDPRFLVVDAQVDDPRLLHAAIGHHASLAVVAPAWGDDALALVVANRRVLGKGVLPLEAEDLDAVADAVGATVLSRPDLQAGYLPESALGRRRALAVNRGEVVVLP